MPRVIRTLSLPHGAQIEIEYNPRRPSIRTIVRQVEALGYQVIEEPFQNQPDIINGGFTSQRVGAHVLRITSPHPIDPRRNEEEIAMTRLQQVRIDSVDVEVTKNLINIDPLAAPHASRRHTPYPIFEDPSSEFYGLTAIQYQRGIILWLEREYGGDVQVEYTLYEDYLVAQNQRQNIYPKYTACLSDLLLLNRVIKGIVHNDAWYLPGYPEFEYGCVINIHGSRVYCTIPQG
jgi:hypothetical protein